jgi:multicomponent K+:H+ antiporter subunit D
LRLFLAGRIGRTRPRIRGGHGGGEDDKIVGIPFNATIAMLSLAFVACATILAGLPPFSGFIAKFALLHGLFQSPDNSSTMPIAHWAFVALLILSGLASLIALTRTGIRVFWASDEREVPRVGIIEMAPIAGLLLLCLTLTVQAGPAMRYMEATAQSLYSPTSYILDVTRTSPVDPASIGLDQ